MEQLPFSQTDLWLHNAFLKQVTAINPSVLIYAGDHDKFEPSAVPRSAAKVVALSSTDLSRLPCLSFKMEYLDSQAVQPMYPRKLVKIISNIPSPSHALMQLCQVTNVTFVFSTLLENYLICCTLNFQIEQVSCAICAKLTLPTLKTQLLKVNSKYNWERSVIIFYLTIKITFFKKPEN